MHITLDIQNEKVAENVLWVLEHFKKDGVVITKKPEQKVNKGKALSDEYVAKNWMALLMDCQSDPDYYKSEKYKEDRGKYLMKKYK